MNEQEVNDMTSRIFGEDAPSIDDLVDLSINISQAARQMIDLSGVPEDMKGIVLLQTLLIAAAHTQAAFATPATWGLQTSWMRGIAEVVADAVPEGIH